MTAPTARLAPAAYLRCFPFDPRGMAAHREALRRFANRLGLLAPILYFDNGALSAGVRPQLELLTRSVLDGQHRIVLVPGTWVFSTDERLARLITSAFAGANCRTVKLPDRFVSIPRPRSGWGSGARAA
ncbi:hypothetical protein ACIF6L_37860 [Kitasatospora sp. NPDC086009]|uniref:hypothetical protein n=1 Tax=unclassified Kitasatospora TaxID=2633591 RepID=UPI0037C99396